MLNIYDPLIAQPTEHLFISWERKESLKYYAEQRLDFCTFKQRLDIDFPAPYCCDCMYSLGRSTPGFPDVSPVTWEEDLDWKVSSDISKTVKNHLKQNPSFAFQCRRCMEELRPWENSELYVVQYSLSELYSVPQAHPGQINASKSTRKMIINIYGNICFNCRSANNNLHIDHILPRSLGGTATFNNLQPLCESCGQRKGKQNCEDVSLTDTMFFEPHPSDSFEGLFW